MSKGMPVVDGNVISSGTELKTFWVEIGAGDDLYHTTTGWDAVTIPVESKGVFITVRSSDDATALSEDAIPFLFSSNSDGSGSMACKGGVDVYIAKDADEIYGYVYTGIAGRKIAVMTGA